MMLILFHNRPYNLCIQHAVPLIFQRPQQSQSVGLDPTAVDCAVPHGVHL
jgi:hypothetical protein